MQNAESGIGASPLTRSPWIIALTVMLATFMEVLDTTVVNVSLPHIAGDLSAGVDESTWALTSYLVSNAIFLPLSGWFSMLFGRKRFYMVCVAVFTVSSLLCGMAPTLGALIFFRVLQGMGGGGLQPLSQAILVETFPREKHGMAMAVFGMGVVLAPIIGPTLGGWITDNYSWRWIFFINIPVGILSIVLTTLLVFDPPYLERKKWSTLKIDYIGLGLVAVGLGFLQVVMDKGQREDWLESHFIATMALLTVAGLVGAAVWEWRRRDPVVDLHLLKERNFALATLTMFLLGFMIYSSTMLLPIYLQTLMGYTALLSGLVISPGGVLVLLAMPMVGMLLGRFQARWLVIFGVIITSLGLFQMARFNLDIDFRTAMLARCVQAVGLAFLFVPVNTMAFHFIPKEMSNRATGLINLARNVGGSVGIAMVTTMLARRTQFHQSVLVSHMTPLDPAYQSAMEGARNFMLSQGANPVQAAERANGLTYGMLYRHSAMLAFADNFWLMGVLFLFIIPLMLLMKKARPGARPV